MLRDGAVVGTLSGPDVSQDGVLSLIAAAARQAETDVPLEAAANDTGTADGASRDGDESDQAPAEPSEPDVDR